MDPRLAGAEDGLDALAAWLSEQEDPEVVRVALEFLRDRAEYYSQEISPSSQPEEAGFYVDQSTGQRVSRTEFRQRLRQALADCPRETWWQSFLGRFGIYL
jgi:uncharacterized iron-regulated membrane protein